MLDFGRTMESQGLASTYPPLDVMNRPNMYSAPWGYHYQPHSTMRPSTPYLPHLPNSDFSSSFGHSHPQVHHLNTDSQLYFPSDAIQRQKPRAGGYMVPQDGPHKVSRTLDVLRSGPSSNSSAQLYPSQTTLVPSFSSSSPHPPMFTIPSQPQATPISQVLSQPLYVEQQAGYSYPHKPEVDDELQRPLESSGADGSNGRSMVEFPENEPKDDELQRLLESSGANGRNGKNIVELTGNEPFVSAATDNWWDWPWEQPSSYGSIPPYRTGFDDVELTGETMPRTVYSKGYPGSNVLSTGGPSQEKNAPGIVVQNLQNAAFQSEAAAAKQRLRWTPELHEHFVEAVAQLGGADKATPKAVGKVMGVEGLTIYHVKSHLQKYRLARDPPVSQVETGKNRNQGVLGPDHNAGFQVTEALRLQLEDQKRLQEQLEVQRQLLLSVKEQGKYLQKIIENQNKYGGGLSMTGPTGFSQSSSLTVPGASASTEPASGPSETEGLSAEQDEGAGEPVLKKARTNDAAVEQADEDPMTKIAKLSVIVSQALLASESKQVGLVQTAGSERESKA